MQKTRKGNWESERERETNEILLSLLITTHKSMPIWFEAAFESQNLPRDFLSLVFPCEPKTASNAIVPGAKMIYFFGLYHLHLLISFCALWRYKKKLQYSIFHLSAPLFYLTLLYTCLIMNHWLESLELRNNIYLDFY